MVKQLFSTLEVIKREFINSYKDLDSMRVSLMTLLISVDVILIRLKKLGIFGQMRSLAKQWESWASSLWGNIHWNIFLTAGSRTI